MIKTLLLLALLLIPASAQAEETGELILPPVTNVSLVHHTYMEPEQFGIFMKVPDAVMGCYNVSGLSFETSFTEKNHMDINVKGYKRTPIKTKNVSYDCTSGTKVITATIPVNANDLRERNIRQIRFKRGDIEDAFDVQSTETSFTLIPRRNTSFRPAGSLSHNFGGGGLVKLSVPMLRKGENVTPLLKNFAYGKALMPTDEGAYVFEDKSGEVLARIGESGYTELGTIQINRPFNNGNGNQMLPTPVKVFATRH